MVYKPVDSAIVMIVGPCIDDTDFKTLEEAIAYDAAGIDVSMIVEKTDGTTAVTAITLTTGGTSDWTHKDGGYYEVEVTAAQNTEEGIAYLRGVCTGVLPFESAHYDIVKANIYDSWVKGTDKLQVDAVEISGDSGAADNAELAFDGTGYGFGNCVIPTVTTLTGHTAQTGDSFARIGATGSALTSLAQASVCTDARLAELAAANLPSDIDDLLTRLSAARAGYLDNLSAGAVAQAATALLNTTWTDARAGYLNHSIATIDTNVDTLIARITAARAGYLDNLSAGAVALAATALTNATWTDVKAGYLNHSITTIDTNVDALLTRLTAARAGYLDELAAANLPTDIDTLLTRLSATRAGYLDELAAANIPSDIDTIITRVPDTISLANIRTQADNALIAINLDHLIKIAVDTDWATTVHLNSALGHMVDVGGAASFDRTTDSSEAIRNRGDAAWLTATSSIFPGLLINTTIATLATQVSFTLTNGSTDDDAYNTAIIIITDSVTAEQKAVGWVENYDGATKTITLTSDPGIFTMAVGDTVDIIATDYLIANIWGTVSSIFTQVGIDGAGLTNMPWNGSWDAEVQSEVNDALVAFFTSADELVDNIWDEILTGATHNISTSAGRRVRELGAYHISSGTAQGGTAYSITLAAGEPATDHIYNRNLLVILAGTGAGQTRTIVDYNGTTKVTVIDRDWWVNPDATSEYTIIPDDTPLVADHGVAITGTNNTITLRPQASAISSTYAGGIIQIMAGTGAGQSRLVDSYDGATKILTICMTWTTNPDNTSVYVILPYGVSQMCKISPGPLANIKTQADDALTDVHLDDLIQLALTVNDEAPNAADFITSSAVAIDDWYNENMLLFTSGALAGLARYVDDYDGATKRIYLTEAFPQAPANTDAFVIVGVSGPAITTAAIADAVWDELESGHTTAGSFGEEVTKQGKKLDRNLILDL